jgi:DNA mismatch repair protein MutS2
MARCGLFICASEGSKVPFVTHLEVAVGDAQSVDAHLSTFAAHLKALNHALENKGPQSLLLIDEICGSTDPEEGSALARSFVESFAQNKVFGVITSHLSPLKVGWTPDSGIINGSLEYNSQSGLPTYQFLMGIPGQSLAIQTAKRVGVSEAIIQRSLDFLSPTTKAQQQGINEIETLKEEMQLLREELRKETRDARENKRRYHDLIQKFRQEKDQWMDRIVKKTEKKIDQLIEQVGAEQVFKKHERLQQIKNELPEVIKASNSNGARRKIETVEEFEKAYPPGSSVFRNVKTGIKGRNHIK